MLIDTTHVPSPAALHEKTRARPSLTRRQMALVFHFKSPPAASTKAVQVLHSLYQLLCTPSSTSRSSLSISISLISSSFITCPNCILRPLNYTHRSVIFHLATQTVPLPPSSDHGQRKNRGGTHARKGHQTGRWFFVGEAALNRLVFPKGSRLISRCRIVAPVQGLPRQNIVLPSRDDQSQLSPQGELLLQVQPNVQGLRPTLNSCPK